MAKHIHAELMAQYAQDAMESETPWTNWEYSIGYPWFEATKHPTWDITANYRRKPKTIVINGFTVNAPLDKEPEFGTLYFFPVVTESDFYSSNTYNSPYDKSIYERGVIFNNKEDAIAMAKAMLRIDPNT
jgi:hypothetical protein